MPGPRKAKPETQRLSRIIANEIAVPDYTPGTMPVIPARILVLPWGDVRATNGDFVVDAESAGLIAQAFAEHATDLPIDYEHQTLGGEWSSPSGQAPAAGWIKSIEIEPGNGIFARVEWTPNAAEMIGKREYRYLSPVVKVREKDKKATGLHSCGLTNKPAIIDMKPLVNKDKTPADGGSKRAVAMDEIIKALGLTAGSDEAACVTAIKAMKEKLTASETASIQANKLRVVVCKAAGLDEKATDEQVVTSAATLRKAKGDPVQASPLLVNSVSKSRSDTIKRLVTEGKLIPAAAEKFTAKWIGVGNQAIVQACSEGADGSDFDADVAMLDANGPVVAFKEATKAQTLALADGHKPKDDEAAKAHSERIERMKKGAPAQLRG